MFSLRTSTKYVICIYLVIAYILWTYKPDIMFTSSGDMKEFGTTNGKTLIYYPLTLVLIAILLFYVAEIFYLKKNNMLL